MNEEEALVFILERLSALGKPVNVVFDEVQEWQDGVLEALVKAKLLIKDVQAKSIECGGCENGCFMRVDYAEDSTRAFIVCDDPEKQNHMGRIAVPFVRLQQWQSSAKQVAIFIADLLGLDTKPVYQKASANYKLGMLKGPNGRHWVLLSVKPIALVINQQSAPLAEVLCLEQGEWLIDQHRINELMNSAPSNTGKHYTPSTSQRETRKLVTQAMYKDWQDEYRRLKELHPGKTGDWYAWQISRLPMAKGRDYATIKKNMKS